MSHFPLGQTLATPAALEALQQAGLAPADLLSRHARGDWGDLGDDDERANEDALETGARLFSAYQLGEDRRVWIITEAADSAGLRTATTILLPSEY